MQENEESDSAQSDEEYDNVPDEQADETMLAPPSVEFKSPFLHNMNTAISATPTPSMRDDRSVFDFQVADDPDDAEERLALLRPATFFIHTYPRAFKIKWRICFV